MPRESNYELSQTLFKEGKAAMIIDGPWSWSAYRKAGIDLGIAPIFRLPNGQWAKPMVASKGYSINANVKDEELPALIELITYLTSPEAELRGAVELGISPSHEDAYADPQVSADPIMTVSRRAFELGRRMPVVPEMRILWDVMRKQMQEVMTSGKSPELAAREMQKAAVEQIAGMRQ
jgi:maltose-binding protein MalE